MFNIFILFLKFFNFIINLKNYFFKKEIYFLVFLYYYFISFNKLIVWIFNKAIKLNLFFNLLKLSIIPLLKIYIYNLKIYNIFTKFNLQRLYNKKKNYFIRLLNYYSKNIDKALYFSNIFKIIQNNSFNVAKKLLIKQKSLYNKFSYCFFINKNKCSQLTINKELSKLAVKKLKIKKFKNLFSLFFFNLFIYLFFIYLFIFWLNNLLNNILKNNAAHLSNILKLNKKIIFYKLGLKIGYKKKKLKLYII